VELRPGYALAANNLAVTLHSMGRMDEAIDWYIASLDGKVGAYPYITHKNVQ
jgi:hypothetical protein